MGAACRPKPPLRPLPAALSASISASGPDLINLYHPDDTEFGPHLPPKPVCVCLCSCRVAEVTEGYSGSDLRQLCVQAAMRPVRELLEAESKASAKAQTHRAKQAKRQRAAGGAAGGSSERGDGAAAPAAEGEQGQGGPEASSGEEARASPAAQQPAAAGSSAGADAHGGGAGTAPGGPAGSGVAAAAASKKPGQQGQECGVLDVVPVDGQEVAPYAAEQLGELLAAAEGLAGEASGPREELRPISMQVGSSCVPTEGSGVCALCSWEPAVHAWPAMKASGLP
jgi:hypothetical protein